MQSGNRKELYTERVLAGKRMYYFDVKVSKDGTKYLVISETEQGKTEHHRIMVFEESIELFIEALQNAVSHIIKKPAKSERAYRVETIRQEFSNAYAKWTTSDDELLKEKYGQGVKIPELAKLFNRKEGAIKSRLTKLGLLISNNDG
ncbi:MAG: PUR family DNA/RNA-binding protein [Anaerolineales bacterium]|nr:PUR family DNA/RNA-binding protein [Anaerolineales bacterium]